MTCMQIAVSPARSESVAFLREFSETNSGQNLREQVFDAVRVASERGVSSLRLGV